MTADAVLWVETAHNVHLGLLFVEEVRAAVGALVGVWLVWLIFALLGRDNHGRVAMAAWYILWCSAVPWVKEPTIFGSIHEGRLSLPSGAAVGLRATSHVHIKLRTSLMSHFILWGTAWPEQMLVFLVRSIKTVWCIKSWHCRVYHVRRWVWAWVRSAGVPLILLLVRHAWSSIVMTSWGIIKHAGLHTVLILRLLAVIWSLIVIIAGLSLIFMTLGTLTLMLLILILFGRLLIFLTAFNTIWSINLVDFNILISHTLSACLCIDFKVIGVLSCFSLWVLVRCARVEST